jgi:hypothetical protein
MKTISIFFLFALSASGLAANENKQTVFTKADRMLTRSACSEGYSENATCWRANLKLKGKLVVEYVDRAEAYDASQDASLEESGMVFFEPDNISRRKLPEAIGYYPAPVKSLWLTSKPETVLIPLLGTERANLAIHGKRSRYKYPVEIVLTQFIADIECDHRTYNMEFSSIRLLKPDVVALSKTEFFGC